MSKVAIPSEELQQVSAQLEQHGHSEIALSAEVELFLRISNIDLLSSIECTEFRVSVNADADNLRAVASSEEDWAMAWERGIEPIRESALQSMKSDVLGVYEGLPEENYDFKAAMVLLASEMVGPSVDRIVTFLQYPRSLVQELATQFHRVKIWKGDKVQCGRWFDPHKGGIACTMDVLVARGKFIREWWAEKKRHVYRKADIREA